MTICVTWQLIVTLDSIHNSCDVFCHNVAALTMLINICVYTLSHICFWKCLWNMAAWITLFSLGVFALVDIIFKTTLVFDKNWQGNILLTEAGVACLCGLDKPSETATKILLLSSIDLCISLTVVDTLWTLLSSPATEKLWTYKIWVLSNTIPVLSGWSKPWCKMDGLDAKGLRHKPTHRRTRPDLSFWLNIVQLRPWSRCRRTPPPPPCGPLRCCTNHQEEGKELGCPNFLPHWSETKSRSSCPSNVWRQSDPHSWSSLLQWTSGRLTRRLL